MAIPNDTATAPRTLYLVQRLHWMYNDETFLPEANDPIRAFANREAAEEYRRALEHQARLHPMPLDDEDGIELNPRDDPEFETAFFEVVEIEWYR